MRSRRRASRGQALVEFALVTPVIVLLAFGFIDLGRAVFDYNTLTNVARQAARVAAVNQLDPSGGPTDCNENHPVDDPSNPHWTFRGCAVAAGRALGLQGGDLTVSYAAPPGTTLECTTAVNVGCIVSITVVHTFAPVTPLAGSLIGPIAMSTTSQMPVERVFP